VVQRLGVAKAVFAAKKQSDEYQAFLDTDRYFNALATIMTAYNAEIQSSMLIVLRRAKAEEHSDGHGGRSQRFGGNISDVRASGR
jgi:dsDNA-binding SOS-regulon protein